MIRVLIVEDSEVVRQFMENTLDSDPEIEVVGTAEDGEKAIASVAKLRPDVITMDVHMPKMNGLEATRRIMETHPTPIVIVSGTPDVTETTKAFLAIEAGALAVLGRPAGIGHPNHERSAVELIRTVKLMSEVRVVRRWVRPRPRGHAGPSLLPFGISAPAAADIRLIAVGASTGGPPVLKTILGEIKSLSVPVAVVQHMAPGFTPGFAEWLAQSTGIPIHIPVEGERLESGHVYVAPDGLHMEAGLNGRVCVNADEPENGVRPAVSRLFRSVARIYGRYAAGVLLTGMGKDGALELKLMKERGAVTIAQDAETSAVHGMPGEAIKIGAATYVLSPGKIASALMSLMG